MSQELDLPDSRLDTDGGQALAQSIAALSALIPGVGGVVSAVASGRLVDRKLKRVAETIDLLGVELGKLRADGADKYVATEDFEDLLEEALLAAARERSEVKRRVYARFLAHEVENTYDRTYDWKHRVLQKLEALSEDHVRILAVLTSVLREGKKANLEDLAWVGRDLRPAMDGGRIRELVEDLRQESVLASSSTWGGEIVAGGLTDLGASLVGYLEPDPAGAPNRPAAAEGRE